MIQRQLKLRLTKVQESRLNDWLWQCTGLFTWAVRKIELDAKGGVYYTKQGFQNLLAGHSRKMAMPSHTMQSMLTQAYIGWQRCFRKIAKKPRLKGARNKLNSIPFPDPIKSPVQNRMRLPGLGLVRFHKQSLPDGQIKCGRIIRRPSGWYLALTIDAEPNMVRGFKPRDNRVVGIDPGFRNVITLSDGSKEPAGLEYNEGLQRLAQACESGIGRAVVEPNTIETSTPLSTHSMLRSDRPSSYAMPRDLESSSRVKRWAGRINYLEHHRPIIRYNDMSAIKGGFVGFAR